jgi:protein CpxP
MKMNYKISVLALLFGITTSIAAHEHGGDMIKKMTTHLNLSKDQQTQMKKIHDEAKPQREAIKSKIKPLKEELHSLLSSDFVDKAKVRSKMEEISKFKIDMKMIMIDERIKINQLLTPEQKEKHKELMKKHHDKMKEKHEKWGKNKDSDED